MSCRLPTTVPAAGTQHAATFFPPCLAHRLLAKPQSPRPSSRADDTSRAVMSTIGIIR